MLKKIAHKSLLGMLSIVLLGAMMPLSEAQARPKDAVIKAPKFPKKGTWLNHPNFSKKAFKKGVTLVNFWDYTAVVCVREIDKLNRLYKHYQPYGLRMLWIHSPEFEFAKRKQNVDRALHRLRIPYPVYLDNDFKLWDSYKVHSWPTKFLVNKKRVILDKHVGEGRYYELEEKVRRELMTLSPRVLLPAYLFEEDQETLDPIECGEMSGETYAGHKQWWAGGISNRKWVRQNETQMFKDRGEREERKLFVQGLWTQYENELRHARDTESLEDYLGFVYLGREVYGIMSRQPDAGASRVYVKRDRDPVPEEQRGTDLRVDASGDTYFLLEEPRLYYIISNEDAFPHELQLTTRDNGISFHSFSFSNLCLSEFEHL